MDQGNPPIKSEAHCELSGVDNALPTLDSHVETSPIDNQALKVETQSEVLGVDHAVPKTESPITSTLHPNVQQKSENPMPAATEADAEDDIFPDMENIENLCNHNIPEVLEDGVAVGKELLIKLKNALDSNKDVEANTWLKTIADLEDRARPTKEIIGVVGNTGAGKSSVINALLDEERLLPTNCLRACTASPTEISYNYSNDSGELYRAEIEFISSEEWIRELEVLFSDLLDGNGEVSREATNTDSEAGVAYAKMKAVYPQKTREMWKTAFLVGDLRLAQATPRNMANEPAVRKILGTTKVLKEETAKHLYRRMQHYVDSKEKSTGPVDHRKRVDISMEHWPLIKVVRIFTKAHVLSTGAVIVDLPGVQDSNAARAAVAANYMKSCTGLWIVAPINRAVDDKTAKSLLGESFKRQLKYDGTYSAVTFICSKTDDISITEAAESLGLEEEISEKWERADHLKRTKKSLQSKMDGLKETKSKLGEELDECDAQEDLWEELQSALSDGKTVYAPSTRSSSKKRKRGGRPSKSRKNLESSDIDDSDLDGSDSDSSDKENSQPEVNRKPLTEDDIDEMISSFKERRKQIREKRRSLNSQVSECRDDINECQEERDAILAKLKAVCIKGRNDYSRSAIKNDFATGIKELDQENAIEEDDETFDPDEDLRDYEEVARSLPVFCVSSRAYQQLKGRLEKDDFHSEGFYSIEDTEIPKLQEHGRKVTEAGRASHYRRWMNDLARFVNTMKLWSMNDGTQSILTNSEQRREQQHLKSLLASLETGLDKSLTRALSLVEHSLDEQIYECFNTSTPAAIDAAPQIAYSWGAPRSEGGLFWATYKATVRRDGVYSGASGPMDFNQLLFDPISRALANGWERCFQRRIPKALDEFVKEASIQLNHFHQTAQTRAEERHTNIAGIITLSSQMVAHIRTLKELPVALRAKITELQREASREFTPVICGCMLQAYQICVDERGPGSYQRMKAAMANHVDVARHSMFRQATETVKSRLQVLCRALKHSMSESVEDLYDKMNPYFTRFYMLASNSTIPSFVDYMRTLGGTEIDRSAKLPRDQIEMRNRVKEILRVCDQSFAPVLGKSALQACDNTNMRNGTLTPASSKTIGSAAGSAMDDDLLIPNDEAADNDKKAVRVKLEPQPEPNDNDVSATEQDDWIQAHIMDDESDVFASDKDDDIMDLCKKERL
ncbi:hypothetical protein F5Y16DRAFT_403978 [Xylariaceae sp. FL0255]|nr:hypothetical protein F5Y16DRAFT_403978 [Xylariaceae sp. FL0255]